MGERSKILIIGATGYLGKYIVQASLRFKHPTFVLVREHNISSNPERAILVEEFRKSGVTVFFGDVNDHESLLRAIKQVDVVFSLMGHHSDEQLEDQIKIVSAITEAGNIKRYFPSEFGFDVDRLQILEPAKGRLAIKTRVRETIRKAGIPFTFLSSNLCATYFLSRLGQVEATCISKEIVHIIGDGNTKVIFVDEDDIATYAVKAVDDPRTLNKVLYVKPPKNILSLNEIVSLWEYKTKRILKRIYLTEQEVLKKIVDSPDPFPFFYAIAHASFIKGEMTNFDIDPAIGIEASELYSDENFMTIDECLNKFM